MFDCRECFWLACGRSGRTAVAVLAGVHAEEWEDILNVLRAFRLRKSAILEGGGAMTKDIAGAIDREFYERGWVERPFDIKIIVDGTEHPSPTHSVDCYNKVAVEVEW